jgi:hypothetical protein
LKEKEAEGSSVDVRYGFEWYGGRKEVRGVY